MDELIRFRFDIRAASYRNDFEQFLGIHYCYKSSNKSNYTLTVISSH